MQPFDYYAPRSLAEAGELLLGHGTTAQVIAGGTDLLLKMRAGRLAPSAVVDVKRLAEMRGQSANGHMTLGALTTLEDLVHSPLVRERLPALTRAAATMASVQVRNLATLGGNLCNAAPSADLAPILIAADAEALIARPGGKRVVPLGDFFTGPGRTVLTPGELLTAVRVPPAAGPSAYLKLAPRACMDIAVVGIGLALQFEAGRCRQARIVLGAVAPVPLRARRAEAVLCGGVFTPERIELAAQVAAEEAQPIDDVRGSAWYRRRMVAALARRGLRELAERA